MGAHAILPPSASTCCGKLMAIIHPRLTPSFAEATDTRIESKLAEIALPRLSGFAPTETRIELLKESAQIEDEDESRGGLLAKALGVDGIGETVEWNAQISHGVVQAVHAKLTALPPKEYRKRPVCHIEVWACGNVPNLSELVCVSSQVILGGQFGRISWMGRSGHRPVHTHIRGWRCVTDPALGESASAPTRKRTILQAIVGLTAAVCETLGVRKVELLADDNGSGRLVEYYGEMGFKVGSPAHQPIDVGENLTFMCCDVHTLKPLAPAMWIRRVVPAQCLRSL